MFPLSVSDRQRLDSARCADGGVDGYMQFRIAFTDLGENSIRLLSRQAQGCGALAVRKQ